MSWVCCLLTDSELFILFAENSQILLKISVIPIHSVLEQIWIKGSYLSQWLPQGDGGPPKESKSQWIEILHGGSQ